MIMPSSAPLAVPSTGNLKLKTANTIVKIKPMTQARAAGIRITPSEIINQTIGNNAIANLIHIKILHHQKCCTILFNHDLGKKLK